jgi:8-oxo-dGTP diphosphatase
MRESSFNKAVRALELTREEALQIGSSLSKGGVSEKKSLRLGCAAVVKKGDKILLGIRGKEPNKGKWILPGGGVEFLESMSKTVERELLEETGLEVQPGSIIGVYEILNPPSEHRVIIYRWAEHKAGEIKPSSDLLGARFFSKEEIKELQKNGDITSIVSQVLKDIGWI